MRPPVRLRQDGAGRVKEHDGDVTALAGFDDPPQIDVAVPLLRQAIVGRGER